MATLRMPPDIIVRSAGIWNSRSPFHQFLVGSKEVKRSYSLAVLTALRVQRDLDGADGASVRSYLNPRTGNRRKSNPRQLAAWNTYRKALGRDYATGDFRSPTVTEILTDIENVISEVRGATVLSLVSLFESYLQCWTLNYLLDRLEQGILWTNEERYLATKLSPVHSGEPEPSGAFILRCLPALQTFLRHVPAFFSDRGTGTALERPNPVDLNALEVVKFWIALRNLVVHNSRWISTRFEKKHARMWSLLFGETTHIPKLSAGKEVLLLIRA